jgi:DNA-binding phage protein
MRKKSAPIRPERDRDIFRVLHAIKGMSAVDIAKKTYVSQQTIRNWRKTPAAGGTRYPQHHTLAAVANVAGLRFTLTPIGETEKPRLEARVDLQ